MPSPAFARLATVTANVKRLPALDSSLKRASTLTTVYTGLKFLPLDEISLDTARRYGLDTPIKYLQTAHESDSDIREGDSLTITDSVVTDHENKTYAIAKLNKTEWRGHWHYIIILEKGKK